MLRSTKIINMKSFLTYRSMLISQTEIFSLCLTCRTFSRRVAASWSRGWAKHQVLNNHNLRNSWCQIERGTICKEISELLNYKSLCNNFFFEEQCRDWTQENESLIFHYFTRFLPSTREQKIPRLSSSYWLPSLIQFMAPLFLVIQATLIQYDFCFKKCDFPPLKQ